MEAIVSPTIVTVTVFVAYVAETMNARFCTLDSVHLICTPRERSKSYLFVLEVSVTVKVAFPVRVGVQGTRVQNEEPPPPDGVCHVAAVPEVAVRTCPADGAVALLTLIVVVAD